MQIGGNGDTEVCDNTIGTGLERDDLVIDVDHHDQVVVSDNNFDPTSVTQLPAYEVTPSRS